MLNSRHEVADFLDTSQFLPGRSAYECVFYAAALLKYCGEPGRGATGSAVAASNLAQYWYGREEGSTAATNTNGASLDTEYQVLQALGLQYHPLELHGDNHADIALVKEWLSRGCPLLICGAETGMHDLALGDRVPYSWTPTGNHAIVASGIAPDGNILVHDTANVDSHGVRPGPRIYDASKLALVSATAISLPWNTATVGVPEGWKDDGTTLTAPNGIAVRLGFRSHVLANHWHKDNWPLEAERGTASLEGSNPTLGKGTQQIFRWSMLGYTEARGVFEEWTGQELLFTRGQVVKYYNLAVQLRTQLEQVVGK
jgi:hypothetical protein